MTSSVTGMRPTEAWRHPVVQHLGELDLGDDVLVAVAETAEISSAGRRLAADGGEHGAGLHVVRSGDWLKSIASTGHSSTQAPQKVQVSRSTVRTTRPS